MSVVKSNGDSTAQRGPVWLWIRVTAVVIAVAAFVFLGIAAWFFFSQHSMIYHPRPYNAGYDHALPANGTSIEYALPFGRQTAFYIPGPNVEPKRIWIAFCGNGSLALDWTPMLRHFPANGDGFLLIDYPGYGRNDGYATIDSTRTTANAALAALAKRFNVDAKTIELSVIGHSLGAAVALDFATQHPVRRVVLISPFTSLREEAAHVAGQALARLLVENYDNRRNLRAVVRQNPQVRVAIFHGTDDDLIPVQMGRKLKQEFAAAEFFPIEGADHGSVLYYGRDQILAWMAR